MSLPFPTGDSEKSVVLHKLTDGYWRRHPYVSFAHDGRAAAGGADPGPTDGGKAYLLPDGYTFNLASGIIRDNLGRACQIEAFGGSGTERSGAGLPMLVSPGAARVLKPAGQAAEVGQEQRDVVNQN
jgi:hypothetical protein